MKTLATLLLALFLFSCSKENVLEPTFENKPQLQETKTVTINTFGWMENYKLKYKRASGWCDTVIKQAHYTVQYQCNTNELFHPVVVTNVETYDKDTLALSVTVNTTIYTYFVINKCEAQIQLQPNQAL